MQTCSDVLAMIGCIQIPSLIFLLCFNLAEPRWRPLFKVRDQQTHHVIPKDLDKDTLARLKLPNKVFCAEMERLTAGIYILTPWWYQYCQDLKEKRAKNYKPVNNLYKPIYGSVLKQLQWLRQNGVTPYPRVITTRYLRRL